MESINEAFLVKVYIYIYTGCPVRKKTFWLFYHSDGHNFLSISIYCFSSFKWFFLYHLRYSTKKMFIFQPGVLDVGTYVKRLDDLKWLFWGVDISKNDRLRESDFCSITSSVLVLKKRQLLGIENHTPEFDKSLTIKKRHF